MEKARDVQIPPPWEDIVSDPRFSTDPDGYRLKWLRMIHEAGKAGVIEDYSPTKLIAKAAETGVITQDSKIMPVLSGLGEGAIGTAKGIAKSIPSSPKALIAGAVSLLEGANRLPGLAAGIVYDAAASVTNLVPGLPKAPRYSEVSKSPFNPLAFFEYSADEAKSLAKRLSPSEKMQATFESYLAKGDADRAAEAFAYGVFENAPQLAAIFAASLAGVPEPAILASLSGTAAGQQFGSTAGNKKMNDSMRRLDAVANGVWEYIGERYSSLPVVKRWISQGKGKTVVAKGLLAAIKRFGASAGQEAAGEGVTQIGQNVSDVVTGNRQEGMTVAQQVTANLLTATMQGAALGAGGQVIAEAAPSVVNAMDDSIAKRKVAEAEKTVLLSPAGVSEFVQRFPGLAVDIAGKDSLSRSNIDKQLGNRARWSAEDRAKFQTLVRQELTNIERANNARQTRQQVEPATATETGAGAGAGPTPTAEAPQTATPTTVPTPVPETQPPASATPPATTVTDPLPKSTPVVATQTPPKQAEPAPAKKPAINKTLEEVIARKANYPVVLIDKVVGARETDEPRLLSAGYIRDDAKGVYRPKTEADDAKIEPSQQDTTPSDSAATEAETYTRNEPAPEQNQPELMTPEERMAALSKRPSVYQSSSPEHGKKVTRSAVTWVKIAPDYSLNGRTMIADRWEARKKATGNAPGTSISWDEAAKNSGMDVASIAATVKAIHKSNPSLVVFDVDRMGNNVGFHIKDVSAFRAAKPNALATHWTQWQQTEKGIVESALNSKVPVSADAVDAYGIKLPPGYVREGDRYVFKQDQNQDNQPEQNQPKIGRKGVTKLEQQKAEAQSGQKTADVQSLADKRRDSLQGVNMADYDARVAANMRFMGTEIGEWSAVPVKRMVRNKNTVDERGEEREMPEFEFPPGYKQAESLYPLDGMQGTCGLCGKTPIKQVYWIQNDGRKLILQCGSECVSRFGEGISGKDLARQVKVKAARDLADEFASVFDDGERVQKENQKYDQLYRWLRASKRWYVSDRSQTKFDDTRALAWSTRNGDDVRQAITTGKIAVAQGKIDRANDLIDYVRRNLERGTWHDKSTWKEIPYDKEQLDSMRRYIDKQQAIVKQAQLDLADATANNQSSEPATADDIEPSGGVSKMMLGKTEDTSADTSSAEDIVTPEMDADYLAAVERGDMETAQRMVDEAARAAGYNVGPVWHGSKAAGFTVFDPSKRGRAADSALAWFFAETKDMANEFAWKNGEKLQGTTLPYYIRLQDADIITDHELTSLNQQRAAASLRKALNEGKQGVAWERADVFGRLGFAYAVFSGTDIKSADPVTRDDQGRVIPLSERFNQASPDIRYSKPAVGTGAPQIAVDMQAPTANGESDIDPLSNVDIVASWEKIFGVPIRTGHYHGGKATLGIYKHKPRVARLGTTGDLYAAPHEVVGHHVAEVTGILKKIPEPARKELRNLDYDPKARRLSEGFAEYMRMYLTEDGTAQAKAPTFTTWLEQTWLPANPEYQGKFSQARAQVDRYRKQGAEKRVRAARSTTGKSSDKTPISETLAKVGKTIARLFDDKFNDILLTMNKVRKIRPVPVGKDPYVFAQVLYRSEGTLARDAWENGVYSLITGQRLSEGLTTTLKNMGRMTAEEFEQFTDFLHARHAIESWETGKNPGITLKDAQWVFDQHKDKNGWIEAADAVTAWNKAHVTMLAEVGGLSEKATNAIILSYPAYIPLKRIVSAIRGSGQTQGFLNVKSPIKRFGGSGAKIKDPWGAMFEQSKQMYSSAIRMRVARMIVDQIDPQLGGVSGLGHLVERIAGPTEQMSVKLATIKNQLEKAGADLSQADMDAILSIYHASGFYRGGEPIAAIMVKGKPVWYQFDPDLYNALANLASLNLPDWANAILAPLRFSTKLKRLGATGLRASFSFSINPGRDISDAIMKTEGNPLNVVPLTVENYYKYLATSYFSSKGRGYRDPVVEMFRRFGGELSTLVGSDFEQNYKLAREMINDAQGRANNNIVLAPGDMLLGGLTTVFSTPEMGPRLAEVNQVLTNLGYTVDDLRNGKVPIEAQIQAVLAGMEVTTNFKRSGSIMGFINQIKAFSNVGWQGPSQSLRKAGLDPRAPSSARLARTLIRGFTFLTLPTILYWLRVRDEDWYQELPAWRKYGFFNWRMFGKTWSFPPRTFEYGLLFSAIPQAILDRWYNRGNETERKHVKEVLDVAVQNLGPDFSTLIPSDALKLALELGINYDFHLNRNIVDNDMDQDRKAADQFYDYNTAASKYISAKLDAKLDLPLSPAKIDHAIRESTGGLGIDILKTPEEGPLKALGYSRLMRPTDRGESVNEFYELRKQKKQELGSLKMRKVKKPELESEVKRLNWYADKLADLRSRQQRAKTPEERGEINRAMTGFARRALRRKDLTEYPAVTPR